MCVLIPLKKSSRTVGQIWWTIYPYKIPISAGEVAWYNNSSGKWHLTIGFSTSHPFRGFFLHAVNGHMYVCILLGICSEIESTLFIIQINIQNLGFDLEKKSIKKNVLL